MRIDCIEYWGRYLKVDKTESTVTSWFFSDYNEYKLVVPGIYVARQGNLIVFANSREGVIKLALEALTNK